MLRSPFGGRFILAGILLTSCGGNITPFQTPTPAQPSEGVFVLCWYPPLQLEYDPASWSDVLPINEGSPTYCYQHYLQSRGLETCTLFEQGPSDLNTDIPPEAITLSTIKFALTVLTDLEPGITHAWYVEQKTIPGFSYEMGVPLLRARSLTSEWAECQKEAEALLASLQMPQP